MQNKSEELFRSTTLTRFCYAKKKCLCCDRLAPTGLGKPSAFTRWDFHLGKSDKKWNKIEVSRGIYVTVLYSFFTFSAHVVMFQNECGLNMLTRGSSQGKKLQWHVVTIPFGFLWLGFIPSLLILRGLFMPSSLIQSQDLINTLSQNKSGNKRNDLGFSRPAFPGVLL